MIFLSAAARVMGRSFSGHTTASPRLLVARPLKNPHFVARGVDPFASMTGPAGEGPCRGEAPGQRHQELCHRRPPSSRDQVTIFSTRSTHLDEAPVDEDLLHLDRDALMAEVKRLRAGIREHRDSSGHELCWHHPKLWGLLPEKTDPLPSVPAWPQFLRGCLKYRESLDTQLPNAPRTEREFDR